MHIQHRATLLAALAAAAFLASSCDNSSGLFASIQDETKQTGSSPFEEVAVTQAFRFDGSYYCRTAKLYSRAVSGDTWSLVSVNGSTDYTCYSAADDGDTAYYAAIENASGDNQVLVYTAASSAWSSLDISSMPSGSIIDSLYFVNGTLFAELHENYASETPDDHQYTLYYWTGSAFAEVDATDFSSTSAPFVGVVWDSGASRFWYATTSAVYQGTGAASGGGTAVSGPSGTFTCLAYSSLADAIYVGTDDEVLWQYASSAWSKSTALDSNEPVTAIVEVGSTSSYLLVGVGFTEDEDTSGGYYEGPFSSLSYGDDEAVADSESVFDTTVYGTAVSSFFWDTTDSEHRLFVCVYPGATSSLYGLYMSSTSDDGTTWSGWDAE
jgi:hypothetical protein